MERPMRRTKKTEEQHARLERKRVPRSNKTMRAEIRRHRRLMQLIVDAACVNRQDEVQHILAKMVRLLGPTLLAQKMTQAAGGPGR
jgi:hypothetical protein